MTYKEAYKQCIEKLNNALVPDYESDTRLLFQYILEADRSFMFMHGDDEVDDKKLSDLFDAVALREKRIPLQHITGYQNFMGLEFKVTKDVLIPRFDTECLVEEAMLVCADGDKVLDVCTGSGCILISLMSYKNDISGYGIDISEKALNVAKENATAMGKAPTFIVSDLFEACTEREFDIIVSNPPYIRSDVIPTLMPEVKDYDPILALDGGDDGLIFYRRIVSESRDFLKKGGYLLVEIGNDQGDDVKALFEESGYLDVKVVKDLCGNDRVVKGHL